MKGMSQAQLYGRGIFTTVALRNGEAFVWEKHWSRLVTNAKQVGIDIGKISESSVRGAMSDVIEQEKIVDGRARITFSDNRSGGIWPDDNQQKENTAISIIAGPRRPVPRPFTCYFSPHSINSRSPLAGVKSCNYLENILAVEDAKRRGCSEAVRLNERGHVAGACMANVFWLRGDRLFTPSLSTGCLPGTTREFVLENLECDEVEATVDEIGSADAVFLTSAGLGIVAVDKFSDRELSSTDNPIIRSLTDKIYA